MANPTPPSRLQWLDWLLIPLFYPEYRRLVLRCYMLSARLELLCFAFTIISPFATAGMLLAMRERFDRLHRDVRDFGRVVRTPRRPVIVAAPAPSPPPAEFRNPWA